MAHVFEFYKDCMDVKESRTNCTVEIVDQDGMKKICGVPNNNRSELKTHILWEHGIKMKESGTVDMRPSQDGMAK
jgi:hypothetical protein